MAGAGRGGSGCEAHIAGPAAPCSARYEAGHSKWLAESRLRKVVHLDTARRAVGIHWSTARGASAPRRKLWPLRAVGGSGCEAHIVERFVAGLAGIAARVTRPGVPNSLANLIAELHPRGRNTTRRRHSLVAGAGRFRPGAETDASSFARPKVPLGAHCGARGTFIEAYRSPHLFHVKHFRRGFAASSRTVRLTRRTRRAAAERRADQPELARSRAPADTAPRWARATATDGSSSDIPGVQSVPADGPPRLRTG